MDEIYPVDKIYNQQMRSSRWMRSCRWMRPSRVIRASGCQCQRRNSPGFYAGILRHSGIGGAADEAVLYIKKSKKFISNSLSCIPSPLKLVHPAGSSGWKICLCEALSRRRSTCLWSEKFSLLATGEYANPGGGTHRSYTVDTEAEFMNVKFRWGF